MEDYRGNIGTELMKEIEQAIFVSLGTKVYAEHVGHVSDGTRFISGDSETHIRKVIKNI